MEKTKPFWTSKTLWINVIAIVATILGAYNVDFLTPEMQVTVVGLVMGAVNIVLRLVTKTGVSTS